ncbi:hypothetical protein Tco_0988394 [Tanacetum coccineum]|uniref:Uncharacterized protein n=1 Tax=Tanacetum coccineum TaxID=301880 RepID=A0ABQ5ERT1_9ASTR
MASNKHQERGMMISPTSWYPTDSPKHGMTLVDSIGTPMATKYLHADLSGVDKLFRWSSKKQDCTSMSSAEAEYVSLSACCAQVEKGNVEYPLSGTEYQLADLFTKALSEDRFKYLVRRLGMRCLTPDELETKIELTLEQSQQGVSNDVLILRFELETLSVDSLRFYLITGLDDGVAASFQRSRIHKPTCSILKLQSQIVQHQDIDSNLPSIKEGPQSSNKESSIWGDC